jgi:hypothetical protein
VPGSGDPVVHAAERLRDRVVDVNARIAAGRDGRPAPEEADVARVGGTQGARDLPVHDGEDEVLAEDADGGARRGARREETEGVPRRDAAPARQSAWRTRAKGEQKESRRRAEGEQRSEIRE